MEIKKKLTAPCNLYSGVCGISFAHKTNDTKLKERLTSVYVVTADEMQCAGCLSDKQISQSL